MVDSDKENMENISSDTFSTDLNTFTTNSTSTCAIKHVDNIGKKCYKYIFNIDILLFQYILTVIIHSSNVIAKEIEKDANNMRQQ